jgi:hypothetical protein
MSARYALQKVDLALDLVAEFKARPFPHQDSHDAVSQLADQLSELKNVLKKKPTDKAQVHAGVLISEVLDLLGAIGNSANVRNPFEIHGPFLSLAQQLLNDKRLRLILTFEWQYIPYTYPQNYEHLPQFIVIGLPASEGSNALVLPAIGHELGHSLWRKWKLEKEFKPAIEKKIGHKIESSAAREEAIDNGLLQLQEFFCDFVGLYIFGQAYLDSFDDLLSPSQSKERDPQYPSVKERARALSRNMRRLSLLQVRGFELRFSEQSLAADQSDQTRISLRLADEASSKLADQAAKRAFFLCRKRGLRPPSWNDAKRISKTFESGMPAEDTTGLGAVLNGSWLAFKSERFLPGQDDQKRIAYLNELTMKSIEILELKGLISNAAKTELGETRH